MAIPGISSNTGIGISGYAKNEKNSNNKGTTEKQTDDKTKDIGSSTTPKTTELRVTRIWFFRGK